MIVVCPACSTQFAIPATAVPPEGRRVRCSRCGNEWHQESLANVGGLERLGTDIPLADAQTEDDYSARRKLRGTPSGTQLPALKQEKNSRLGLKIVFFLFILLAIFAALIKYREHLTALEGFYSIIGLQKTDGLRFENFVYTRKPTGNTSEIAVEGDIVNRGEEEMVVPPVDIAIYTLGGNIIGRLEYPSPGTPLKPGEKLHIKPEITNVSASAARMVLDIGNTWEVKLREAPEMK